jgi:HEAT repeat protein
LPEAEAPLAELFERLGSPDRPTQRNACDQALARLERDPALLERLQDLLRDENPRARFSAAYVLFHARAPSLRILPALLDALDLEDGDVRWAATHMLTVLGRLQPEVLPVLLHEALHADSSQRRRMGIYALRELAPERPEALRAALSGLDAEDPELRRAALSSLAKLREPTRDALDRVLEVLTGDADLRMRRIAAVVLADLLRCHPDAGAEGRAALEAAAGASDPALARSAAASLARLGPPQP